VPPVKPIRPPTHQEEIIMLEGSTQPNDYSQLSQVRVPLEDASEAFTARDEAGKIPIILIPTQLNRIRNELVLSAAAILVGGLALTVLLKNGSWLLFAIPISLILLVIGVYRAFRVRIPEGAKALLTRGGRYIRTLGSGTHYLPPWYIVSHLVTQREIPFDVPVVEAPTQNNVRANVDTLFTFRITDPYKFVYNISAADFDQVFQATCQDTLRAYVRTITSDQVMDLKRRDVGDILEGLNTDVAPYGVEIMKVNVTFAQPPAEFMRSQEARQLAVLQQAEQEEVQALAIRRQKDADDLARQKVVAEVERDKELLLVELQKAQARHAVEEQEAETEAFRLARMEERIEQYPQATAWEVELAHLEVARALAGNTRAMLQIGNASDISRAFLVRDILQDTAVPPATTETDNSDEA